MKLVQKYPYISGLVVILFCWLVVGTLFTLAAYPLVFRNGPPSQLAYFLFLHINFVCLCAGIVFAVRRILRYPMGNFLTDHRLFSIRSSLQAAIFWLIAAAVLTAVLYPVRRPDITLQFSLGAFFPFLLAAVFLTPVQVLSEEMLFRAYLWRWVGSRAHAPRHWVTCAVSGAVFLAVHGANPEFLQGEHIMLLASYYFLFGAFLMAVVIIRGGIEHAFGIHLGNNLFAILIVNYQGSAVPSPSIWVQSRIDPPASMTLFLLSAAVYALIFLRKGAKGAQKP